MDYLHCLASVQVFNATYSKVLGIVYRVLVFPEETFLTPEHTELDCLVLCLLLVSSILLVLVFRVES